MYKTKAAHHILENEVDLISPKFPKGQKSERRIFSAIITGFIGLAFEGISSFYIIKDIKCYIKQLMHVNLNRHTKKQTYAFRKYFGYVQNL